jgi:hypothetical protein
MRRLILVSALVGSAFLVPSPALADPPLKPAERLCERQEGQFLTPAELIYRCVGVPNLSDAQLALAQRLCEAVYKGDFERSGPTYECDAPSPS